MFDLCHHALAASADIGIVMEYLMDVLKKFEKKSKKKKYHHIRLQTHTSQPSQYINWEKRTTKSTSLILKDLNDGYL